MSNYTDGEKLVEAQVALVDGFTTINVTRGKWSVLNKGASDHYVILKRGESSIVWVSHNFSQINYRTIIEVWQRVKDDQVSYDALLTYADDIKARLEQYRKLADTAGNVLDANLTGMSAVTEQWRNNSDGPSWLKVDLYLDWSSQTNVTFAE